MRSFADEYKACKIVEQCLPDAALDVTGPDFWELDTRIRTSLAGYFAQYEQGLIHSMEFVDGIMREINRPR